MLFDKLWLFHCYPLFLEGYCRNILSILSCTAKCSIYLPLLLVARES
ncbi:hypothetical protein SAMN06269173_10130 [Hymenobacter mucosus]|uniref:Uncharacterized protein n=1 Tax=Hymenobacter mucosus TaxID=1411120 RepID=A0A238V3R6_9BACT|nr:hypothetical protein SAMN06269173_10130 [Hymenobacter mucosus]